ncbi:RNA polymerase sigma factor [Paenibacillus sp. OAS669]|uniref:RNA polymerase sigma factor n=1 Tax=Paenibacillus sp. OAS669 TaxID=2663821 RepID=UPI001789AB88|nr:sigma-70 family RNA polymerase sigma factor [Paenibacillus sp. OAS669]MBE1442953.1 RNA polymerase sigma-70 factor (ECF subfamily) [Paenibacillus sp. OAS669]
MEIKKHIDQVLQGHPDAFEWVVRRYQRNIAAYCYFMLGNRQEAEDAAQEVFFKAYRNLASYRHANDDLFLAWLYKIAGNHCRTLIQRKKKWKLLMPLFGIARNEKSAEQIVSDRGDMDLQWLEGLNAAEKEILALRVIEDRSFQEISELLGISSATVRKRFERLKKKLKRNREQWEDTGYEQRFEC